MFMIHPPSANNGDKGAEFVCNRCLDNKLINFSCANCHLRRGCHALPLTLLQSYTRFACMKWRRTCGPQSRCLNGCPLSSCWTCCHTAYLGLLITISESAILTTVFVLTATTCWFKNTSPVGSPFCMAASFSSAFTGGLIAGGGGI